MSSPSVTGPVLDASDVAGAGRGRSVTVSDIARVLLYRWLAVAICAFIGLVGALGYTAIASPSYVAKADVVVRAVVTNPFSYPASGAANAVNMNVESGIATGSQVTSAVAAKLGVSTTTADQNLSVDLPIGGQIIRFLYRGSSQAQAILGANTAATSYLTVRQQMYAVQQANILKSYDTTITGLNAQASAARKAIAKLPQQSTGSPSANSTAAVEQLRGIDDQLTQLVSLRATAASTDTTPGFVTSPAAGPISSTRNSAILLILAGLLGGALIGALVAYAWEATDRRVRSPIDARDITSLSMIGSIRRRGLRRGSAGRVDVKYVAHAIAQRAVVNDGMRVVVISARPQESGRLVADLGVALAGFGHDVYIGTSGSRLNGIRARVKAGGAMSTLSGKEENFSVPRQIGWTGMDDTAVIPALRDGSVSEPEVSDPEDAAEGGSVKTMVQKPKPKMDIDTPSARLRRVIELRSAGLVSVGLTEVAPKTGIVLLDAPSAETDDAGVHEARTGIAVLVIARDLSRVSEVRRLNERLHAAGVAPVGFVFTRSGHA
jgi:capsular polysaccharide biosynthesis protein